MISYQKNRFLNSAIVRKINVKVIAVNSVYILAQFNGLFLLIIIK